MQHNTTLPITEVRKNIFSLATKAHRNASSYYTITEHGRPKIVMVAASRFQSLLAKEQHGGGIGTYAYTETGSSRTADRSTQEYQAGPFMQGYNALSKMTDTIRDGLNYEDLDALHEEREVTKAQLYLELIRQKKYPVDAIQMGQYIRVGGANSRRYIEADIIVDADAQDVALLLFLTPYPFYDEDHDRVFRDLFDLAKSFDFEKDKKVYLVHYARRYEDGEKKERCDVVEFHGFKSFTDWKRSKKQYMGNEIPLCE